MLRQDYILRLIREFFTALERMLELPEVEQRRAELWRMYEQYLGSYDLYHHGTTDEVMEALATHPEEQRLGRMEMAAELFMAEADTESEPMASFLRQKALHLLAYIDTHGRTFSFQRLQKMQRLRQQTGA